MKIRFLLLAVAGSALMSTGFAAQRYGASGQDSSDSGAVTLQRRVRKPHTVGQKTASKGWVGRFGGKYDHKKPSKANPFKEQKSVVGELKALHKLIKIALANPAENNAFSNLNGRMESLHNRYNKAAFKKGDAPELYAEVQADYGQLLKARSKKKSGRGASSRRSPSRGMICGPGGINPELRPQELDPEPESAPRPRPVSGPVIRMPERRIYPGENGSGLAPEPELEPAPIRYVPQRDIRDEEIERRDNRGSESVLSPVNAGPRRPQNPPHLPALSAGQVRRQPQLPPLPGRPGGKSAYQPSMADEEESAFRGGDEDNALIEPEPVRRQPIGANSKPPYIEPPVRSADRGSLFDEMKTHKLRKTGRSLD